MFFKNLKLYRVLAPIHVESLAEACNLTPARPCGSLESETLGWWPPLGRRGSEYTHTTMGRTMLCARKMEKVLPSAAVKEIVDERVYAIEQKEERRVGRAERKQLQERVIEELLPNAPQRPKDVYLYYDPSAQLLAIDTSSEKMATDILNLMRRSLGSLHVIPPRLQGSPSVVMTLWVSESPGQPFSLGYEAVLEEPGEAGSKGTFTHQNLRDETIAAHIRNGMRVTRLALTYKDRAAFTVDESLTVTKFHLGMDVTGELDEMNIETDAELFDAEFVLMAGEVADLVPALIEAFGGEEIPEQMGEAA